MSAPLLIERPRGLALAFNARRVVFTLAFSLLVSVPLAFGWESGVISLLERTLALGLIAMSVFGLFEQWPPRLPRWLARWVLQVLGVALAMPLSTYTIYVLSTPDGAPPFWETENRIIGFMILTVLGVLLAPWTALAALVRQKEAIAHHQALAFQLERSELERQASAARLNLLQAQVAPHFLFNTLANVQALVDAGSPQASGVLRSLIAYLRAAVPRLHESANTIAQEVDLVRAYLQLMHMRMPDRLTFALDVAPDTHALRCPPLTLLTLVENAVRHGIDPGESGGHIDIVLRRDGERCTVRVEDSGVGLREHSGGLGTGLATLRERLKLTFGDAARLSLRERAPHGVCAELEFPAREVR